MGVSTETALRYRTIQGNSQTGAATLGKTIRPDRWAEKLRLEGKGKEGDRTKIHV
jgi:hypothetical protein